MPTLDGLTVIHLRRVLAWPFCTMRLGAAGASPAIRLVGHRLGIRGLGFGESAGS